MSKLPTDVIEIDEKENMLSPKTKKKILEHKIEIQDHEYEDSYKTCCTKSGTTDRRLLNFSARFTITIIALSCSLYGLLTVDSCDPKFTMCSSFITYILGSYLGVDNKNIKMKVLKKKNSNSNIDA